MKGGDVTGLTRDPNNTDTSLRAESPLFLLWEQGRAPPFPPSRLPTRAVKCFLIDSYKTKKGKMKMIKITESKIEALKSNNKGWNKQVLSLIGVNWPPKKGWKKELVNKNSEISKTIYEKAQSLKNSHL